MPPLFMNAWMPPGIQEALDTYQENVCWGSRYLQMITNVFLDGNSVDAGNTPTTVLRPGLLLGFKPATNKWQQWNPAGTDGSQFIAGVLLYDQRMTDYTGTATDRFFGYAVMKGLVKSYSLIIPGNASAGIVGDPLEFLVRTQLNASGKFTLDDNYNPDPWGSWGATIVKTAAYTVTQGDNNTLFVLNGGGAVTFTLPVPVPGLRYGFVNMANQNMIITCAATGQLIAFNNAAAQTVTFSTAGNLIGAFAIFTAVRTGAGTSQWVLETPTAATVAIS